MAVAFKGARTHRVRGAAEMKARWIQVPDIRANVSLQEMRRMVNPAFADMRGVAQTLGACRAKTIYGERE